MNKYGLYTYKGKHINKLKYNSCDISSTRNHINSQYGFYINDGKLMDSNTIVAESGITAASLSDNKRLRLGEIDLQKSFNIPIAPKEFNKLLSKEGVKGYRKYQTDSTYLLSDGALKLNEESITTGNDTLGSTYTNIECPTLVIRYFDGKLSPGERLRLTYYVDTLAMDFLNRNVQKCTFTIYVYKGEDVFQNIPIITKTTYAGWHEIELPSELTSDLGETYFSVKCVDSSGVGSPVQFFNIWVTEPEEPNYYQMTAEDLSTYSITKSKLKPTEELAWKNKQGFTQIFQWAKDQGYNGIKLFREGNDSDSYWISFYKNISPVLGEFSYSLNRCFKKVEVDNNGLVVLSEDIDEQVLYNLYINDSSTYVIHAQNISSIPIVNDTTSLSEGIYYYVYVDCKSGDLILFPNNFTVDLNGCSIVGSSCPELRSGFMMALTRNFNTHIINGKIIGPYNNVYDLYNFKKATFYQLSGTSTSKNAPSQWQGVVEMSGSSYCSFRNLDISGSVGYDGGTSSLSRDVSGISLFFGRKSDNADTETRGVVNPTNGQFMESPLDDELEARFVRSREKVSSNMYDYARCKYADEGNYDILVACAAGRDDVISNKYEIFVSFYEEKIENGIKTYTYLCTIKSKLFLRFKKPKRATHLVISAYARWFDTISTGVHGHGLSSSEYFLYYEEYSDYSAFDNIRWHDTRTIAFKPASSGNVLYRNITYNSIAKLSGQYAITGILGDIEDSHWFVQRFKMENCKCTGGSNTIAILEFHLGEFVNCSGFTLQGKSMAGRLTWIIDNCDIFTLEIQNYGKYYCFQPCFFQNSSFENFVLTRDTPNNTADLAPNRIITFTNCRFNNFQGFDDINLHHSINGINSNKVTVD